MPYRIKNRRTKVSTKAEKQQKHARKLFSLKIARTQLQEDIKDLNEKIAKEEERIIDLFGVGHHTIGKLILIILQKGRTTYAWKNIAEDLRLGVDEFRDYMIEEDYNAKAVNQFAKLMIGAFDRTKKKFTKTSEDSVATTVDIDKAS